MDRHRVTPGFASSAGGAVVAIVALLWVGLTGAPPARAAQQTVEQIAPGLDHIEIRSDGLVTHVARVAAAAPVRLQAILAADNIDAGAREITSELCRRHGATVCVNADFAACADCREVFGGFANGGILRRSFHPHHEQFSVTPEGYSSQRLQWQGELRATLRWPAEGAAAREEVLRLGIGALNRSDTTGAVLFSTDWGAATSPSAGRRELLIAIDGDVPAAIHAAELLELRDAGPLAAGRVALRGEAGSVTAFWDAWAASTATERSLVLDATPPAPVLESVGAHPVLLRNGERMPLDQTDGKVSGRHPRTIVAWTPSRELLLLTIDGRQPGWSRGATLAEATDLVIALGASDALNLDGGGSTTFVAPCPERTCVRNRPSGGDERSVPAVLAIVVDEGVEVTRPAPPPPPAPSVAPDTPTSQPAGATPTSASAPEDPGPPPPTEAAVATDPGPVAEVSPAAAESPPPTAAPAVPPEPVPSPPLASPPPAASHPDATIVTPPTPAAGADPIRTGATSAAGIALVAVSLRTRRHLVRTRLPAPT